MEQNPAWLRLAYVAIHRPEASNSLVVMGDGADLAETVDRVIRALHYLVGMLEMSRQPDPRPRSDVFYVKRRIDHLVSTIHVRHYLDKELFGQRWTGMVLYDGYPKYEKHGNPEKLDSLIVITAAILPGCIVEKI